MLEETCPRSLKAFRPESQYPCCKTAKKIRVQDREWQMFSDANVYQYSAQITCSVTGSFAEGER